MQQSFSSPVIAGMVFNTIVGIGLPLVLVLFLRKKYKLRLGVLFIGASAYILADMFALSLVNTGILSIPVLAEFFEANTAVYAFVYGIIYGLIQVGGYYLIMRYMMKEFYRKENSLLFGVGVRIIDTVMAYGINSGFSLIMVAWAVNARGADAYLQTLDPEYLEENRAILENMMHMPVPEIVLVGTAGFFMMFLSIAVSVLVFQGVKREGKIHLLAVAAALSVLNGFLLALYNDGTIPDVALYVLLMGLLTLVSCALAFIIYRNDKDERRGKNDFVAETANTASAGTSMHDKIARVSQINGRNGDSSKK